MPSSANPVPNRKCALNSASGNALWGTAVSSINIMDALHKSRTPPKVWSGARRAPRCSVGGEQLDNAIGSIGARLGAGPCAPPRFARPLRDGEFLQLDGSEIADIAAHTLGGVEQYMRLGAERITQHA